MAWITTLLGYILGAFPTAYIAGHIFRNLDIRRAGDDNMGAADVSQMAVLLAGIAAVIGHNWPVFAGFRGGRGESTTIGILLALVTQPMLIVTGPALLVLILKRNVVLASAFGFIPLPFVCWRLGVPGLLIGYSIALPCLVAFTHFLRTRSSVIPHA